MNGKDEYQVKTTGTQTTSAPAQFTGCHHHGSEMFVARICIFWESSEHTVTNCGYFSRFCVDATGEDVEVEPPAAGGEEHDDHGHDEEASGDGHKHCHFHAGVESVHP